MRLLILPTDLKEFLSGGRCEEFEDEKQMFWFAINGKD